MKRCPFCPVLLTPDNQSREHLYRKDWLRRLGSLKQPVETVFAETGSWKIEGSRKLVANASLAGGICSGCNSGWMDALDWSVDSLVMGEAMGAPMLDDISLDQRVAFTRWIFKVACCARLAEPEHRRHLAPEVFQQMRRPEFVPEGIIAGVYRIPAQFPITGKGVEMGIIDQWTGPYKVMRRGLAASRIKFAIQYDRAVFFCAYFGSGRPTFVVPLGTKVVNAYKAKFEIGTNMLTLNPLENLGFEPTPTNLVTYFIGLG